MRVLVAGDRGYIGAVLVPFLRAAGHEVDGLDLGLYEGCDLGPGPGYIGVLSPRDIRDADATWLGTYDAVICLAALSNDPLGHLNPAATYSINLGGSSCLARAAKEAGVNRFLFASSCSLYGAAGSHAVGEDADLYPVTPYGESKVLAERVLSLLADDTFSPVYLRNATTYGVSPRLRLDIVVNNLTAVAMTTGEVRLESDGSPWRPLVHVEDISRAFLATLEAPRELVHDQAFNVGRPNDNVQIRDIAEMVRDAVPGSRVSFAESAGPDLRNYRVDFSKLADTFPELRLRWGVREGVDELVGAYAQYGLSYDDFTSSRFVRLRRIRELLSDGILDQMLRRQASGPLPPLGAQAPQKAHLWERCGPTGHPRRTSSSLLDTMTQGTTAVLKRSRTAFWRLPRGAGRRLGWGVADQAVSSITNFAVGIFVARSLGAVQLGAFSLAYVTYSFVLNASRGLSTDPLLVRFSGAKPPIWRRAVARCTGTASLVGCVSGVIVLAAAVPLNGTAKSAFLALGLTLPGLMLQDSWRFAFFAIGRGDQAFLNDLIWALIQLPAMVLLRITGHASVFSVVLVWGIAAAVAAGAAPVQAGVFPKPSEGWAWILQHRDLGYRYLAENTSSGGAVQLRTYGIGLILGLAAVGYVRAAEMLMGPFLVLSMGISWAAVPEAVRVLRRSSRHLQLFCLLVGAGLATTALAWGVALLVLLPRGLGHLLLGSIWRPAYPLILPATVTVIAGCFPIGASAGLRALSDARRSLRAQVLSSGAYLIGGLGGALAGGAMGTMRGTALSTVIAAPLWWWQLRASLREFDRGVVRCGEISVGLRPRAEARSPSGASGWPAGAVPNGAFADGLLSVVADPRSEAAEAFRFAAVFIERVRAARGSRLSVVFISPRLGNGKSTVVANVALALAEGGTKVLVVDADAAGGGQTARLLLGTRVGGFEEVLAGRRALADCIQPSPFDAAASVLGRGPSRSLVTGVARFKATSALLAEAKASFDVVLIDSPALLEVAGATELVSAADAAITVLGPDEPIRDHTTMAGRLGLLGTRVIGYIYNQAPTRAPFARIHHSRSAAHLESSSGRRQLQTGNTVNSRYRAAR